MKQFELLGMAVNTVRTMHGFAFKTRFTGDSYALLAVQNRHLAMGLAIAGAKCAHFQTTDCFECHPPHGPMTQACF